MTTVPPAEPDGLAREHEDTAGKYIAVIVLAGVLYFAIGHLFGALDRSAASGQGVRPWRLAAWAVSVVVFAAHLAYARLTLRRSSPATALDVALGVALGAFGLAVAAFLHGVAVHHRFPLLAMAIWPVMTAIPAFLVALVMAVLLERAMEK